jgi:hypothetical protein
MTTTTKPFRGARRATNMRTSFRTRPGLQNRSRPPGRRWQRPLRTDSCRRPDGGTPRRPPAICYVPSTSKVLSNGSYVDGPLASIFISAVNGWRPSVICPACRRGLGPLALMKSDDPGLPIKGASFRLLTHCGVSDSLRSSRRVVHHVVVALAELLSLRSPFECAAPDWDRPWRRYRCGRPRRW